jgi:phosphoribosylamine--glycine ligase
MKVLVIGSGGREHAMVWKLAQSSHVTQLWAAPGSDVMATERLSSNGEFAERIALGAEDLPALVQFALEHRPDLTVVGPDNPLALGIVDQFEKAGLRIWGPNQKAARFESSKAFSQQFMERHGIPTARSGTFTDPAAAKQFAAGLGGRCAVKADGLALGKGVLMAESLDEAEQAIQQILVDRAFGEAGRQVVIQEFLEGTEVSLHALVDGKTIALFPTSQDHKRVFDGHQGPNTGGMGTYSPAPFLNESDLAKIQSTILQPWLAGCQAEGIDYCGLLYPGLMLTANGPKVIEFNVRFGDPETQVYLTRLENDLFELLNACVDRQLHTVPLRWSRQASVCVVIAAPGYPGTYRKGLVVEGLDAVDIMPVTKVFHSGTCRVGSRWETQGGRVLGVTSWRATLAEAREQAYEAVSRIHFAGMHFRRDIAAQAIDFTSRT